ncbi:MAG: triose-phosphate isomerase [Firmicutes bacterium]|nr:triose-phosphate isomerase [Bacillota bacterium]
MRTPIIAGNWKMNKTVPESVALVRELKPLLVAKPQQADVIVCPPFTALYPVSRELDAGEIALGAQDLFWAPKGAYTGEISAAMLLDLGVSYVIVGHSERRAYQNENNALVAKKLAAAFEAGLRPILCVGEKLAQREAGLADRIVRAQLEENIKPLMADQIRKLIIAYEPVWAIGTGRSAEPRDAGVMARAIRTAIAAKFGTKVAAEVRVLYGGSVTGANSKDFLEVDGIDGALVGGASLKAEEFAAIVKSAS